MNKPLTLAFLALALPLATHAESTPATGAPTTTTAMPAATGQPGGFPKDHGQRMDKVAQELGLSEEQKTKMTAIIEEKHQKIKAIHDESRTKLQAVLTPEQFSKFDNMHPYQRHGKPE